MKFRRIVAHIVLLLLLAGAGRSFGVVVTNVTPPLGSVGEAVVIQGSGGFAPGGMPPNTLEVRFNGVLATSDPAAAVTDNQINANVPVGATTGFITVKINTQAPAQSPQQFTVIGNGPYVTNFTPVAGDSAVEVVLTGVHFSSVTNVSFNGKLGVGFSMAAQDEIRIHPPAGVTTGPLIALSSLGASHHFSTISNKFSTATNFFVRPVITGFSPANGRIGTNVTVTGTNFTAATAVRFGGVNATFWVTNNGIIGTRVPTNAPTGPIEVESPYVIQVGGPGVSASSFSVLPTITGFSPGSGPVGTPVTISGYNLTNATGLPTVTFSGAAPVGASSATFTSINVNVPANATNGLVTVTTTYGSTTSTQLFYLPATISTFTPTNSAPGTRVKITGNQFFGATGVSFNGVFVATNTFKVTNNTIIGVTVPAGVTTGPIGVMTPAGTATSGSLLFYAPPVISGFSPSHGLPDTVVTITGINFLGARAVLFGGSNALFSVVDNGTINATVPTNAQTGPITVIAPAGTNITSTNFVLDYTADLAVTITDVPDPVFVGSNLVYTITITNRGPFGTPVMVTNTLPGSVRIKAATTSQGTLNTNGSPVWASLGPVGAGGSATIMLTVAPTNLQASPITDVVWVSGGYPDPGPVNNTNSAVTTLWPLPLLSIEALSADLVRISWPAPLSNFTLQFKTVLAANGGWTNNTNSRTISGPDVFVTETNVGPARFYRLTN